VGWSGDASVVLPPGQPYPTAVAMRGFQEDPPGWLYRGRGFVDQRAAASGAARVCQQSLNDGGADALAECLRYLYQHGGGNGISLLCTALQPVRFADTRQLRECDSLFAQLLRHAALRDDGMPWHKRAVWYFMMVCLQLPLAVIRGRALGTS
jgi:hypothetical protein